MKIYSLNKGEEMEKSNNEELANKVLEIGKKYKSADKPTKVEVGKLMTGKRRATKRKKKCL
ncbi:hypothetical protein [Clostridium disporicum]|uniref:hypothetical protein n=1 Tax=Clostridium disporicum TaxID=84024 RepID=UPI0034A5A7E0